MPVVKDFPRRQGRSDVDISPAVFRNQVPEQSAARSRQNRTSKLICRCSCKVGSSFDIRKSGDRQLCRSYHMHLIARWPNNTVHLLCKESLVEHLAIHFKQVFSIDLIVHGDAILLVHKVPCKRSSWAGTCTAVGHALIPVLWGSLTLSYCSVAGIFEVKSSSFVHQDGYEMELVHHSSKV